MNYATQSAIWLALGIPAGLALRMVLQSIAVRVDRSRK